MINQMVIYSNRNEVQEVLTGEIRDIIGFKPLTKDNFEDFRHMVDLLGNIDLVVIDACREDLLSLGILQFLESKADAIKHILLLTDMFVDMKKTHVFTYENFELLVDYVRANCSQDEIVEEYTPASLDTLSHLKVLPFDLYIKISHNRYVKRIPACEEFDVQVINSLRNKGVYELYYDKKFNRDFSRIFLNSMMNDVEREYDCTIKKLEVKNDVFMTTKEIVNTLGLSPRVATLCETMITSLFTDYMNKKDPFSNYLKNLTESKLSFHYRHIELTSYIATQMIDDHGPFASSDFSKRIVFAAFFCDVTLKRPEWIHIRREEDMKGLPEESIKEIKSHALKAAELVTSYQNAPIGVDRIIRQHHGALNGIGFSEHHYDKLCPLTKCLLSAQEAAYMILTQPEKDVRSIVSEVVGQYRGTPLDEMFERFERKCKPHFAKTA